MRVLCAGILVADIFLPPLERVPAAGELVVTGEFVVTPGGCAANTAIALVRLGLEAAVVGCVGDDPFGELVVRVLGEQGVDTRWIRRVAGVGTSKTVIIGVHGEDRRFVHTVGANAAVVAADLDEPLGSGADALYIGGFLVLPGLPAAELAPRLERARAGGLLTVLDVGVPAGAEVSLASVRPLLAHLDAFVPNDDEARALTGEAEPHAQARALAAAGADLAIVTCGAVGVVLCTGGEVVEVPARPVTAVDPSGAGDAFDAGLIAGLLAGWDVRRSAELGTVLGACACSALGCWEGLPSRAEAEAALA